MIKKFAVVAAAVSALVLADASWAVASSGGYGGKDRHSGNVGVACVAGKDALFSNTCGNTYVFAPSILGSSLNLLSPPTVLGGGGGNN
jgi:nicotinamide mononucleotide (NMN) deamidase PncC